MIRPGTGSKRFVTLDAHPVSILALPDGFLVAAHSTPFTAGSSFIGSGRLLRLDKDGGVKSDQPVPDIFMLNGMARLDDGSILIADSVKSQILRYDVSSGVQSRWLADARLAPQQSPYFQPGANGVKVRRREVLISSSAARKLFRITIGVDGGPAGELTVLFDLPGADDFALLPEGSVVMTTHGDRVLCLAANGQMTVLTSDPRVLGNTAVAVTGSGKDRRAIILGKRGFSEGGKADAAVVSVPLPE